MALVDVVEQANQVIESVTTFLVTPLLIFFVGIAVGKLTRNLLRAVLSAVELDTHAQRVTGQPVPATELLAGTAAGLIYAGSTIWALRTADILLETSQLIAVILGLFAAVALILGARDFLPNLFYGLRKHKKLALGDTLKVDGISGEISQLGWLSVQIVTEEDETVAVPYRGL